LADYTAPTFQNGGPPALDAPLLQALANAVQQAHARLTAAEASLIAPPVIQLTDGPTIAIDASASRSFRVTVGGDRTLGNPTGAADGQLLLITVTQDVVGGRAVSLGAKYRFPAGIVDLAWSTAAGAKDRLAIQYDAADDRFDVLAFQAGYGL